MSAADKLLPLSVVLICLGGLGVAGQIGERPREQASTVNETSVVARQPPAMTDPNVPRVDWLTLPAPDKALTRIGFGSCLVQGRPQPIWDAVIAARPDLFLMMGDNVYGDFETADGAKLAEAYARAAREDAFQRAVAAVPMLATWDDHDFGRNDGGADFAHKATAEKLFRAFWAGSGTGGGVAGPGIAYAQAFGPPDKRVQIIMLDTRTFRSPLKRKPKDDKAKGRYVPDDDPTKTLLGEDQWAWLAARLGEPAVVTLIVSSIQVISQAHRWERWGNLPRERTRLYELIAQTGRTNIIFLSGDRHRAGLYRLDHTDAGLLIEATSSSLNRSFDDPSEAGPHQIGQMFGANNFGLIDIDWQGRLATVSIRDAKGRARRALAVPLTFGE
jgi:alkaline phosphatase D